MIRLALNKNHQWTLTLTCSWEPTLLSHSNSCYCCRRNVLEPTAIQDSRHLRGRECQHFMFWYVKQLRVSNIFSMLDVIRARIRAKIEQEHSEDRKFRRTQYPIFHGRTKQIHIGHHFIQELVHKKKIKLQFCRINQLLADIFINAISNEMYICFRQQVGEQGCF